MSTTFQIKCIGRESGVCEIDPSICLNLNDENTAESKITIPDYERLKHSITFDILSPTLLTRVPSFILRKFPKLSSLRLRNTGITTLSVDSFAVDHSLDLIDLSGNKIKEIPTAIFANLKRLKDVNLAHNLIARIEPSAFDQAKSLRTLILSNNQLQTIASGSFDGADNLQELYLDSNNIEHMEIGSLNLKNLEILTLQNNHLASLPNSIFQAATKLEKIDLSENQLQEVRESLKNCENVYSLNLNDNPTLKDGDLFNLTNQLPNLSYLYLSNTGFKLNAATIRSGGKDNDDDDNANFALTHLDLSNNNLNLPNIFLHLVYFKGLKTVVLNNNQFVQLNGVSDLKRQFPRLATIQLKHNRNFDMDWLNQAKATLQHQHIKLITDQ